MSKLDELKKVLAEWISEGYIEGDLLVEPEWYVLWQPEELEEINEDYQLEEYAPGFVTFGGNGGGELLVINDVGEVFFIPAIGMSSDTAIKIASSLSHFKGFMKK
ncbi:SMI1/KNR4 family protein [Vibrio parahaemolyticus]|uniref:SMI1/KNR4 family protein n=1 Tax=Vibrio parahaemolyticus TaxID=670 RepID=A0A7Y0SJV0_VIBPH|nr:SMI1/KNR4 family protein [Vibrio parahaemolyticus]EKD9327719.1 SMI1/KNR4 family protein [Vibrio vulnificus]ELA7571845.1 SMI1/KNR4 family protein [Vibrio alginolyticus]EKL9960303.1 SMI1/KNR4 family protein [Vibrio parahaemolyticus]ELQ2342302.1 SMI1/KNR4 family protein [Vibrio vulnificus]